jgi:hypothetical protein
MLEALRFEVTLADSAEAALRRMEGPGKPFDLCCWTGSFPG